MSTIELRWKDRQIGPAQTPRRFLDMVIDERSLYDVFGDRISPLGWLAGAENQTAANRLLLIGPADFPNNRRSIYVCPECGDLGCGAISAVIEEREDKVIWRDFGYQNNYDENIYLEDYADVGPFIFERARYDCVIKSATEISYQQ